MFSDKNDKNKKKKVVPTNTSAVTILTPGCHFNGKFFCRGSSRIAGKIEGQIVSEGLLIIEECAEIQADIQGEDIIVQGNISGTLEASGKVELTSTCTFTGDITCPSLIINEGAQFNGTTKMVPKDEISKRVKKIPFSKEVAQSTTKEPEITVSH